MKALESQLLIQTTADSLRPTRFPHNSLTYILHNINVDFVVKYSEKD